MKVISETRRSQHIRYLRFLTKERIINMESEQRYI